MRIAVWITLLLATVSAASARTWIVDQHGTGDFTIVRDALVAAGAGDSILIHPGTYDEYDGLVDPLTLEAKPLTLLGTGDFPEESALRLSVLFRQTGGSVVENLLLRRGITAHIQCRQRLGATHGQKMSVRRERECDKWWWGHPGHPW